VSRQKNFRFSLDPSAEFILSPSAVLRIDSIEGLRTSFGLGILIPSPFLGEG
jgi:hypothetical protein